MPRCAAAAHRGLSSRAHCGRECRDVACRPSATLNTWRPLQIAKIGNCPVERCSRRGELPRVALGFGSLDRRTDRAPPARGTPARYPRRRSGAGQRRRPARLPRSARFESPIQETERTRAETTSRRMGASRWRDSASASLRPFLRIVNSSRTHARRQSNRATPQRDRGDREGAKDRRVRGLGARLQQRFSLLVNGDRVFHAASTIKVAILLAVMKAVDEGRAKLDDSLHVRNRFLSVRRSQRPYKLDRAPTAIRSSTSQSAARQKFRRPRRHDDHFQQQSRDEPAARFRGD